MEKRTIAVIFGGCSPEYPVSLESSHSVVVNFDREKYDLILLGITKGGEWFRYYGGPDGIENDTWREGVCVPAVISPDRETHGIIEFGTDGVKATRIDAAFPVMHGKNGEDGTIQGLCEMAGIPIIGCGALASAICMDKDRAHRLASLAGVDVPKATVFTSMPDEAELARRAGEIGFPVFVKPVRAGSSFGITKVSDAAALMDAVKFAFRFDREVIIEEAIGDLMEEKMAELIVPSHDIAERMETVIAENDELFRQAVGHILDENKIIEKRNEEYIVASSVSLEDLVQANLPSTVFSPSINAAIGVGAGTASGIIIGRIASRSIRSAAGKLAVKAASKPILNKLGGAKIGGAIGTIAGPLGTAVGILGGFIAGEVVSWATIKLDESLNREEYRISIVEDIEIERSQILSQIEAM